MASPQAAGAAALLVSAAEQFGVQHQPAQIRQALTSSARYLAGRYQAYEQGNGLINVGAAWDLLKTNTKTVDISSSVAVNTVLSGFLATPGDRRRNQRSRRRRGRRSLHAPVHVHPDERSRRDEDLQPLAGSTMTGRSARPGPSPCPRTCPSPWTSTINPATSAPTRPSSTWMIRVGRHRVPDDERRRSRPTSSRPRTTRSPRPGRSAQASSRATSSTFRPALRRSRWTWSAVAPPPVPGPSGSCAGIRGASGSTPTRSATATTALRAGAPQAVRRAAPSANPQAGVWEVTVDARRNSDAVSAPFTLTASILGASVSPNPDVIPSAPIGVPIARSYTITNLFGAFTGRAVGTDLGSAYRAAPSISLIGATTERKGCFVTVAAGLLRCANHRRPPMPPLIPICSLQTHQRNLCPGWQQCGRRLGGGSSDDAPRQP